MKAVITQSARDLVRERAEGADEDVHFTEALATTVIETFSRPHDRVLDPFAGFGTTLVVAERLGRVAVGVELLADRVATNRRRLGENATVLQGDSRLLTSMELGTFKLCLTSPPYMSAVGHPENPLTGYRTMDGSYETYLAELGKVFAAVAEHLEPGGHLVINAANIRTGDVVTPLAWDIARESARYLTFCGESYLDWDELPPFVASDYLLVFRRGVASGR